MALNRNLDDAEQWVADWSLAASTRAEQAREMSRLVRGLSATAADRASGVEVTVDASGVPVDLRLDAAAQRLAPSELARRILALMRRAQATLAGKVAEAAAGTVGADSPAGRAVIDSFARRFPSDEPVEQESGRAGR